MTTMARDDLEGLLAPRLDHADAHYMRRSRPAPPTWVALAIYALVGAYVAVLFSGVLLAQLPSNVVPPDPPAPASPADFSETRATATLGALVDVALAASRVVRPDGNLGIAGRLSTTDAIVLAADLLQAELEALQATYPDLGLEVDRTSSAGVRSFADQAYVIAYTDVVNVAARLPGRNGPDDRAVLLSAHYDSTHWSPGASANAASVATAIEVLRTLMARAAAGDVLNATVIVLFDDSKEAGLLGIDAFSTHPWFPQIATYVNMDSLGGWGRPLLTQLGPGNDWLASVYKSTVPYAEASVIGTELFEVSPSFTNFNHFAETGVPGIEFDLYRNGYIYNTGLDTLDTYQNGTLYVYGQNVLAYLSGVVAAPEFYTLERLTASQNRTTATYYDVLLGPVVAYAPTTAIALTSMSAVLTLIIFAAGLYLYTRQSRLPVSDRVAGISIQMLFSIIFIGFDVFVSVLMAAAFGVILDQVNPLAWYANVPIGVFGIAAWAVVCSNFFLLAHASGLHWFRWPLWNRGYGGAVVPNEVLVACSVQIIFTVIMITLTAGGWGAAYLPFWYCMSFNVAALGAVIYFGATSSPDNVRPNYDAVAHEDINGDVWGSASKVINAPDTSERVSTFPYPAQTAASLTRRDRVAWTLFYVTWTIFPTLLTLNLAYSSTFSIVPVLARLGLPQGGTGLGLFFGIIYGLFAVAVTAPWFALQQRYQHRSVLSAILATGALIALVVGMFAVAPFTDARPRQVEVTHYTRLDYNNETAPQSFITLSAPNPGRLSDITNEMSAYTAWTACTVPQYRFLLSDGLCLGRVDVVKPNVTTPTLRKLASAISNGVWEVELELAAPDASAILFRFTGDLVGWSLVAAIPPPGPLGTYIAGYNFPGYIEVKEGRAILIRSRADVQQLTLRFDVGTATSAGISFELWSNVRAVSPLQQAVIDDLPSWAAVWGKSNVPGPIVTVLAGALSSAAP